MGGVGPLTAGYGWEAAADFEREDQQALACGGNGRGFERSIAACIGVACLEESRVVDCPACLRLIRDATDPVRYDFLRERGLVPELPLVSG